MISAINFFSLLLTVQFHITSNLHGICLANMPDGQEDKILHIKKDSTVAIKLKSLSTSGYRWSYSIEDSSIVSIEKRNNEFPASRPKHIGDSGLEVFLVKGLKKGETKIFFIQKRSWKNSGDAIKKVNYAIRVND
jgi:predicted secreted protein